MDAFQVPYAPHESIHTWIPSSWQEKHMPFCSWGVFVPLGLSWLFWKFWLCAWCSPSLSNLFRMAPWLSWMFAARQGKLKISFLGFSKMGHSFGRTRPQAWLRTLPVDSHLTPYFRISSSETKDLNLNNVSNNNPNVEKALRKAWMTHLENGKKIWK